MTGLAFHWEGSQGAEDHANCASVWWAIEDYHERIGLGSGTAYTKLYCMHGQVFEGKGWGFRDGNGKVCYANGTDQANRDYWAACYMAGPGQSFTPAAQHAAYLLGQEAVALGTTDFQPHKTFFNTQCPGPNIEAWLAAGAPDSGSGDDMTDAQAQQLALVYNSIGGLNTILGAVNALKVDVANLKAQVAALPAGGGGGLTPADVTAIVRTELNRTKLSA